MFREFSSLIRLQAPGSIFDFMIRGRRREGPETEPRGGLQTIP
jgi:hypothetical protein